MSTFGLTIQRTSSQHTNQAGMSDVEDIGTLYSVDLTSEQEVIGSDPTRTSRYAACVHAPAELQTSPESVQDICRHVEAEIARWQQDVEDFEQGPVAQEQALTSKTSFLLLQSPKPRTAQQPRKGHGHLLQRKASGGFTDRIGSFLKRVKALKKKATKAFQPEPLEILPTREPRMPSWPEDPRQVLFPQRTAQFQRNACEQVQSLEQMPA